MSFQPVIPMGGLSGWAFLGRTQEAQREAFDNGTVIRNDTAYFEDRIAGIKTAEDLVSDRRLLRVALGAFGLQDDLDNRYFIRKILEEGSTSEDALAMKMTDTRYREFAEAFGFGNPAGARTGRVGFGAKITAQFRVREFEVAIGQQDQALRLAMTARRELPGLLSKAGSEEAKWLRILGNPPLRQVFEAALGMPKGIAQIDIDKQVEFFRDRASGQLGIEQLDDLQDADRMEGLVRRFLLRDQMDAFAMQTGGSVALTLLQTMPRLR